MRLLIAGCTLFDRKEVDLCFQVFNTLCTISLFVGFIVSFFFFNKSGYTTDFIEIKNHTILKRQGYQTSGTKTVNI
jgi:hypothetical protein